MADAVRAAMRQATTALLTADQRPPRRSSRGDAEIDALYRQVEDKVYDLLARQAPVASDLRALITALHVAADLERMGDLAEHVAKTALRRHPSPAVPAELRPVFTDMAEVADRIAGKIATVLAKPDADLAAELDRDDDAMDELHKSLFGVLLGADWPYGVEAGVDARCWAASTSATPTTRSTRASTWSSWSPASHVRLSSRSARARPRRPGGPCARLSGPGWRPRRRPPWPPPGPGTCRRP